MINIFLFIGVVTMLWIAFGSLLTVLQKRQHIIMLLASCIVVYSLFVFISTYEISILNEMIQGHMPEWIIGSSVSYIILAMLGFWGTKRIKKTHQTQQ